MIKRKAMCKCQSVEAKYKNRNDEYPCEDHLFLLFINTENK
jgi:hypothetical protein